MPSVRLRELAARLLELQPAPPREVSFGDAWSVYSPLAIYQSVGLLVVIVVAALVLPQTDRLPILIAFAIVTALDVFIWWAIAARLQSALRDGVEATAVVIQPAGARTPPRVQVNGRETILSSNLPRRYRPGDRIQVLTNPAGDKVWFALGQAAD